MPSLLHLSDPHFGTERPAVVCALLDWVAQQPIDIIVISGDITQRARASEFRRARAFVDELQRRTASGPVLVNPGNHDIPLINVFQRLVDPFRGFREAFGSDLEPSFENADIQLQLLNTVSRWRHKNGVIRVEQIEHVAQRLATADDRQLKVVVTHQPLAVPNRTDRGDVLRGNGPAIARWVRAGADLVLGGHIHLPYVCPVYDAAEDEQQAPSCGNERLARHDGAKRLWVVQAGTAASRRLRHEAGNSFNLIRFGSVAVPSDRMRPQCEIERWDFDEDARAFRRFAVTPLGLAGREGMALGCSDSQAC